MTSAHDRPGGGGAEEPWRVPLADVVVDEALLAAARETLVSGWWSMGPRVAEFERAFAEFVGARHALAVSSGTAALHLALLASGCRDGSEVVLPSLNFVAAANTIVHAGSTPVFCDIIGERDLNLDPTDLRAALSPKTKVVVVLHYGGHPCDMDAVMEIAGESGLVVIEDAAHAPGATWRGRACGTLGHVGCFSFFSNKNLPLGEGGMLVTDNDGIADRARRLRSHGMTTLTWDRHRGHASSYDVVVEGFNYRLDEVRASIGFVQLGRLAAWNEARARIVARYREALDGVGGIAVPFSRPPEHVRPAHHLAVALVPPAVSRDAVRERLAAERIQTSVHYPPIHRFSVYAERSPRRPLPRTEAAADRLVTLPLFPHMRESQVDAVIDAFLGAASDPSLAAWAPASGDRALKGSPARPIQ